MIWKRSLVSALASGIFIVLAGAVLDGGWPDRSAGQWAVFIGGFVVIWLGFTLAEVRYTQRQQARTAAA